MGTGTPPTLGVLVALCPVFLVSPVVVPLVPVRPPSVICVVRVVCSPLSRSGASGIARSTPTRSVTLSALLWLPLLCLLWSWPVVIRSTRLLRFLALLRICPVHPEDQGCCCRPQGP